MNHRLFALVLVLFLAQGLGQSLAAAEGWQTTLWDHRDFTGSSVSYVDPVIDHTWGSGSPHPAIGVDTFSGRWTGRLTPSTAGAYVLRLTSDDGVRLWLDGVLVHSDWSDHASRTAVIPVDLTLAGHDVQMDYYEHGGDAVLRLHWEGPGVVSGPIPAAAVTPQAVAPVSPWEVTISAIAGDETLLTWAHTAGSGADFRVERRADDVSPFAEIAVLPAGSQRFEDTGLTVGATYQYRVVARAAGQATPSTAVSITLPTTMEHPAGLWGSYFDNRDFTAPVAVRRDLTLFFAWGSSAPMASMHSDTFSVRWLGRFVAAEEGIYEFRLTADDGVRFWLGGVPLVDQWTGPGVHLTSVTLTAGSHDLRCDYMENYGSATMQVEWRRPGGDWAPLGADVTQRVWPTPFPPTDLSGYADLAGMVHLAWDAPGMGEGGYVIESLSAGTWDVIGTTVAPVTTWSHPLGHPGDDLTFRVRAQQGALLSEPSTAVTVRIPAFGTGTGLTGLYAADDGFATIVAQRLDAQIAFDWAHGSPMPGLVPAEHFSVRWVGEVEALVSGTYRIHVRADNRARLIIDGTSLVNTWGSGGVTDTSATIALQAGQRYPIRFEMREDTSEAHAFLEWSVEGLLERQLIATSQLYPHSDETAPSGTDPLVVAHLADRLVELAWATATDDTFISHYELERDGSLIARPEQATFRATGLLPETTYGWRVRAIDAFGVAGPWSTTLTTTTLAAPPFADGTGLRVSWYADIDQRQWVGEQIDPILDHQWTAAPFPGVPADGFSGVWQGWLIPRYSEAHTLRLSFDAGARVWIDGVLRSSTWRGDASNPQWSNHTQTHVITLDLEAERRHAIRIDFADTADVALLKLTWSSPSQSEHVVPTSQLVPAPASDPLAVTLQAPARSRTSPAWVHGTQGGPGVGLTAFAGGSSIAVVSFDGERGTDGVGVGEQAWLVAPATPDLPPGVVLNPIDPTPVRVVAQVPGQPIREAESWIRWDITDMAGLPYGLDRLILRRGESLLLAASGGADLTLVDDAQNEVATWSASDVPEPRAFTVAGHYTLIAHRAGMELSRLQLTVVGVNWDGPIACHVDYRRGKNVTIGGADLTGLTFVALDPQRLSVDVDTAHETTPRLGLRPFFGGPQWLAARLGADGPVVSMVEVEAFTLYSTAYRVFPVISIADGMLLGEADMVLLPWVAELECEVRMFTGGITLDDGTTRRTFPSSDFTDAGDGGWRVVFRLLRLNQISNGFCHAFEAFQHGERVSP